jgi:hypothetical protein
MLTFEESLLTPVATLRDVMRQTWNYYSRYACHAANLSTAMKRVNR